MSLGDCPSSSSCAILRSIRGRGSCCCRGGSCQRPLTEFPQPPFDFPALLLLGGRRRLRPGLPLLWLAMVLMLGCMIGLRRGLPSIQGWRIGFDPDCFRRCEASEVGVRCS